MKSIKFLVAALVVVAAVPMFGATATANLNVNANVTEVCTVTTAAVAFGTYDPLVANFAATAHLDMNGSVTVTCTKGAGTTSIDLGVGGNAASASGTTRAMSNGAGGFLSYELYRDSAGGAVWGTGAGNALTLLAAPSKAARTYTVYGRIPGGQDVPAGSYADVVLATLNY